MGTTPTYSWPYPEATDPVAQGAQDIEDLALAVESTVSGLGGGKILQVVSTTKTDTFSASIATGAESAITGLSATITPTSASSTIHVVAHVTVAARTGISLVLYRDATAIGLGDTGLTDRAAAALMADASNPTVYATLPVTYVDSPSTTSATTYALHLQNQYGATITQYINGLSPTFARSVTGTSTITVMEVSA